MAERDVAIRAEIDRLGRECGCGTGLFAAVLAGISYPVALIAGLELPGNGSLAGTLGTGFAVVLGGALAGKALGIGQARLRRAHLLRP